MTPADSERCKEHDGVGGVVNGSSDRRESRKNQLKSSYYRRYFRLKLTTNGDDSRRKESNSMSSLYSFALSILSRTMLMDMNLNDELECRIWRLFKTFVNAFVFLDKNKDGFVSKNEMAQAINESRDRSSGKIVMKRFEEVDWDQNGSVSFKEFLFAFTNWVGIDDEEDE
ncbi:putative calcium-binding protein CML21 [Hibiscus syriacus]|uniref:Calcium-binding protein CML21 n=1 Tax=Hibiscus syriacus TaxID=106335 RepID=A0A6A3CW03_HIBSY|nr:putative calcium-binding protein CML21 [Hibiscus syriacus]